MSEDTSMSLYKAINRLEAKLADVGRTIEELQAKVDALMLEYCPDEMTVAQKENWARQKVVADRRNGLAAVMTERKE